MHVPSIRPALHVSVWLWPLFANILSRGGNRAYLLSVLAPRRAAIALPTAANTTLVVTANTFKGAIGWKNTRPTRGQVLSARGRPPQAAKTGKMGIITRTAVAILMAYLLKYAAMGHISGESGSPSVGAM